MKTFNGYEFEHSELIQNYFGIASHDNVTELSGSGKWAFNKCVLIKITEQQRNGLM